MPCVPFMGELKGVLSGISVWDLSHDPEKMAEAEIIPFNRYGYDRMDIGPNSRGITEALGGKVIYPRREFPIWMRRSSRIMEGSTLWNQ